MKYAAFIAALLLIFSFSAALPAAALSDPYSEEYDLSGAGELESELAEIFITSKASVSDNDAENAYAGDVVKVKVEASKYEKCGRCWVHSETVGTVEGFDGICADCVRKLTE